MANQPPPDKEVPQRTPEGFLLMESKLDRRVGMFFSVFGLFWTGFSGFMFFYVLQQPANFMKPFSLLFVSVFVLIGLILIGLGVMQLWIDSKLHPAELVLSRYPLRPGETCDVRYRRRLRKGRFPKGSKVEVKLLCDEWVEYRQGTDTRQKTQDIWSLQLPARQIAAGVAQADYGSEFCIPADGAPSFFAAHNRVRWRLIVNLDVPGIPQVCRSDFWLNIVPEKHAS